jgi:hypothetical protein
MYGTKLRRDEAVKLDNGDTRYGCGCITFWGNVNGGPFTALYRHACSAHRRYAERCGILVSK